MNLCRPINNLSLQWWFSVDPTRKVDPIQLLQRHLDKDLKSVNDTWTQVPVSEFQPNYHSFFALPSRNPDTCQACISVRDLVALQMDLLHLSIFHSDAVLRVRSNTSWVR
jgi:hypothetical protein